MVFCLLVCLSTCCHFTGVVSQLARLTHRVRDKMAANFLTTFSIHFQYIFQSRLVYWRIYASHGLNELTFKTIAWNIDVEQATRHYLTRLWPNSAYMLYLFASVPTILELCKRNTTTSLRLLFTCISQSRIKTSLCNQQYCNCWWTRTYIGVTHTLNNPITIIIEEFYELKHLKNYLLF